MTRAAFAAADGLPENCPTAHQHTHPPRREYALVCAFSLTSRIHTQPGACGPADPLSALRFAWQAPKLAPRMKFTGHTDTVDDVTFHPTSVDQLCSVGDDRQLLFWDARTAGTPAGKVANAHKRDVLCVSWSPLEEHLVRCVLYSLILLLVSLGAR